MRKGIIYVYFNRAKYEKEGIEKYYVGQTVRTISDRAGKDGRGYHWADPNYNNKFTNSIRKWGWESFESRVLEEVYEEDLDELEKFYIEQFDSFKNGYNSTLGGEGTRGHNPYANKTEEEMKEIKEKKGKSMKKIFEDPKTREKCASHGENHPMYGKGYKISGEKNGMYGKGYKIKGEKNPKAKGVYCNELNIVFSYLKLAEKYCINILNSKIGPIREVCDGKRNFTGKLTDGTKLTWNWLEDVDQEILDKAEYIDSKKYEELLSQNVNVCK